MEREETVSVEVRSLPTADMPVVAARFANEWNGACLPEADYLQALEGSDQVGLLVLAWSAGGNVWLLGPKIIAEATKTRTIVRALLSEANRRIEQRGATFAQVLLNPAQTVEAGWYTECGYDKTIALEFLLRMITENTPSEVDSLPARCGSIGYAAEHHDRFLNIFAASYLESPDCAILGGIGEPENVLADYRGGGFFDPKLWRLLQVAGEDVGCLLLRHQCDEASLEMVYLGILPRYRARGLGNWATSLAITEAKRLGCRRLTVAVDATNTAACRLYARWGFNCFAHKTAQIRTFGDE